MTKTRWIKIYVVQARIVSGNSGDVVWEGEFEIPSTSIQTARRIAIDVLHMSPYYDDRIDPRAVLDAIEHTGEIEVLPSETPDQTAASVLRQAQQVVAR